MKSQFVLTQVGAIINMHFQPHNCILWRWNFWNDSSVFVNMQIWLRTTLLPRYSRKKRWPRCIPFAIFLNRNRSVLITRSKKFCLIQASLLIDKKRFVERKKESREKRKINSTDEMYIYMFVFCCKFFFKICHDWEDISSIECMIGDII